MTELAVRRWSTDDVRFDERLSYWTEAVSRAVFGVTCKAIGRGTFRGSISVAPLDGLHVALSEGSDRSNARTAADISADTDYTFFMFASFDAPWVMNWRGNPFKLEAGDVFFGDTRQVQAARMPPSMTTVRIPPSWASTWLADPERLAGQCFRRNHGWGAVLSAYVERLSPVFVTQAPLPQRLVADNIGALLTLAEAERWAIRKASSEADLLASIMKVVRERAQEIGLVAADVANSLNVSERTLHRTLAGASTTFLRLLTRSRVDVAKRMLETRHLRRLSTGEIGRRAGFADQSHFVRVMSSHLGAPPARYRQVIFGGRTASIRSVE